MTAGDDPPGVFSNSSGDDNSYRTSGEFGPHRPLPLPYDIVPIPPEGSFVGGAGSSDDREYSPQVPKDKWVRPEESDAEKALTSITGHHAVVRSRGRPLRPPKRFRHTPRGQSVVALFFVLALTGLSCFGLLKLVTGGASLLRPHIAATTTPEIASPSSTAPPHK